MGESIEEYNVSAFVRECIERPLIAQRSKEWFELRKTRITGSMVDSLLGSNPFSSFDELVAQKAGCPNSFNGNAATEYGTLQEPIAIKLYEEKTNRKVFELGLTLHPSVALLAHSPDGISCSKKTDIENDVPILLEVKCPFSRKIKKGVVPKYYMGQLQLGLHVFDLQTAHFVQYCPSPFELDICVVPRDESFLDRNLETFERFWREVEYWKEKGWRKHPYVQAKMRHLLYHDMVKMV